MKLKNLFFTILMLIVASCNTEKNPNYLKTNLSFEKRAEDLVSRMTLDEKVSQLSNGAKAIERLGVPQYNWWNECLHGVARAGKATVFPQSIGLAATWDREQISRMADVTSTEARAKYNDFQAKGKRGIYQGLTFWSPNINIFRDPRWGRGMETYGEDPYLTGEIGTRFIQGLQGNDPRYFKVIATSKHYAVHSGPESQRHTFNAVVSERDFRDTYFPAFKKTIEEGKAYSVMCAYNAYMGQPCCGSDPLLEDILRNELGFKGYVVSDCGAIRDFYSGHKVVETKPEAAAMAVLAGTDLNCGGVYPSLVTAVKEGLVSEADIDVSVKRLMLARMKLGMFDPPEDVPWSDLKPEVVSCSKHNRVALETARKSMVLLKNEDNALPLSKELKKIAVLGPNAEDIEVMCGNYNGTPFEPVTPLQGIIDKMEGSATVKYARGCPHAEGLPFLVAIPEEYLFMDAQASTPGLNTFYYTNKTGEGEPVMTGTDKNIDFYWWDKTPKEGLEDDNFSVRWKGYLKPNVSGKYALGGNGKNFKLLLDGKEITGITVLHRPKKQYADVELKAGKIYEIEMLMWDKQGDASCSLMWDPPSGDLQNEAMETVKWADQVIMFMGLSPRLEGEQMKVDVEGFAGGDRISIALPSVQRKLIKKVVATGKPVVLVLLNGSAVSINWENENIPAILEAWYPGETAGTAIADILFGDYNPGGKLPVTFYKSENDLPNFEDYAMAGKTYRYYDGDVLYPFGYGLSYSTFTYQDMKLSESIISNKGSVTVSVKVTNTSEIKGDEVVQCYIHEKKTKDARPRLDLRGFERIRIPAGESVVVKFQLSEKELAYYNIEKAAYTLDPGSFDIYVGPSSDMSQLLHKELTIN